MLRSMHLIVREASEAFEPEGDGRDAAPVGPVLHPDAYSAESHAHHHHGHGPHHGHSH
jgi:urease accessory protein